MVGVHWFVSVFCGNRGFSANTDPARQTRIAAATKIFFGNRPEGTTGSWRCRRAADDMSMLRLFPIGLFCALCAGSPAARTLPRISSGFGERIDPIRGTREMHRGIDLPGPRGEAVLAAEAGIVRLAGPRGGYGNLVEIEHPDGLRTRYGHLSAILVHPGEAVAQGQPIARVGATGHATGNHLHFEVWSQGRARDPLGYFGSAQSSASYPSASRPAAPRPTATAPAPFVSAYARALARGGAE
jgi:murein DD-endopeptidase MepM/ murein hydrolase activator NlpD